MKMQASRTRASKSGAVTPACSSRAERHLQLYFAPLNVATGGGEVVGFDTPDLPVGSERSAQERSDAGAICAAWRLGRLVWECHGILQSVKDTTRRLREQ